MKKDLFFVTRVVLSGLLVLCSMWVSESPTHFSGVILTTACVVLLTYALQFILEMVASVLFYRHWTATWIVVWLAFAFALVFHASLREPDNVRLFLFAGSMFAAAFCSSSMRRVLRGY